MELVTTYTHDSGTLRNYSAIAKLHTLQITTAHADSQFLQASLVVA
jgi:hypothetical protein